MILVGNQRGGAKDLALHLLKAENDHVEIHELRGFAARDLRGAFNEAYAVSRGTRCKQYLFSLSLNPPATANVPTEDFEAAIARIEKELDLSGQPRAIVFHEKQGRRHAHCVWSRIRAQDMKAVQLSFTHRKLMEIARDLYLEHGWQMPHGLTKTQASDPRNFTLAEWQQAKQNSRDPRAIKTALQDAWAISDTRGAFSSALKERGYWLARGDSKSFVAVDRYGEVYSLPRWIGLKTREVRNRLGDEADLSSVTAVRAEIAAEMRPVLSHLKSDTLTDLRRRNTELRGARQNLTEKHRDTRKALEEHIEQRAWAEARERQARFRTGLKGIWDWARGENRRIREINEAEARAAAKRDRQERDALIFAQLEERRRMADLRGEIAREFALRRQDTRADLRAYDELGRETKNNSELERRRGRQR